MITASDPNELLDAATSVMCSAAGTGRLFETSVFVMGLIIRQSKQDHIEGCFDHLLEVVGRVSRAVASDPRDIRALSKALLLTIFLQNRRKPFTLLPLAKQAADAVIRLTAQENGAIVSAAQGVIDGAADFVRRMGGRHDDLIPRLAEQVLQSVCRQTAHKLR